MNAAATLAVADRIALTLEGLRRAVAARVAGGALAVALIVLIWRRVRRIEGRILRLLARFQAGRLWVMPARPGRPGRAGGGGRGGVSSRLPVRFGWLLPLVPYEAAGFASQLRVALDDSEMKALLEASPQARRVLAPLCRMLGIEAGVLEGREEVFVAPAVVPAAQKVRVRRTQAPVVWGRIPLPRGVLAWARREGFGKVPRG